MTTSGDESTDTATDEHSVEATPPDRLVWVSVATTSADPAEASLLEVALAVTDNDLSILAETPEIVIAIDEQQRASIDPTFRARHEHTGLLSRVGDVGISVGEAQARLMDLLQAHCEAGKTPLCGHEVWKARGVLRRLMPNVVDHVHYRLVELTTIEALAERWYPDGPPPLDRELTNAPMRCRADVRRTIERLRAYREQVMSPAPLATTPAPPPTMD